MQRLAAIAASLATVALIAGGWYATRSTEDALAQCRNGAVGGDVGGAFELVNARGETVTDADVITEPSLVYFGYTFCPDICPMDMVRNADAVDLLAEQGYEAQPVFITIDPARDTPEVVGDFAANLHDKAVGLTGSEAQIKAAGEAYRTYYKKQAGDPDYYLMDHTTFTYLVLPEEGFVDFFRREVSPEQMAETVACYIDAT